MYTKDEHYMSLAIREAQKGQGFTKTNPIVGAIIAKNNNVLSKGYHKKFGGDHAEISALKNIVEQSIQGATLYVTLEPCSTDGKTPPCTNAIIKSGINRVVIGVLDPNPVHKGKAIGIFKRHNIEVKTGVLEERCKNLIANFTVNAVEKRPCVILKMGMTLDGKIATKNGFSKWITSEASRKIVHKARRRVDAIMAGKNTILADNPELTVRHVISARQPDKIIFDSNLDLPLNHKVFAKVQNERIFVITKKTRTVKKENNYIKHGIELISCTANDLKSVLKQLYRFNIGTILLEGGNKLATSFLKEKLIDKVMFFYAPKIIGGDGLDIFGNLKIDLMNNALELKNIRMKQIGNDFLIEGEPFYVYRPN